MEGVGDQKKFMCKHIERGINLERLSQLSKSKLMQCEPCTGKGRSSQKKSARFTSPAQQSCQQEEKWVCLACGHVACDALLNRPSLDGEEDNGKLGERKDENKAPAQGHAWGHFVLSKHPLAMQVGDNCVYWCFSCSMPVDYPMPLVNSPDDLQAVNWRNPLQDAANVVRGKASKKKSLFKDPVKVCYTMEPVRSMIDTVRSVIDSATHMKTTDVLKSSSSIVRAQSLGSDKKHFVKGLLNLGNTCFFNSVLQNLFALDVLRKHFSQEPADNEGPLTSSLRSLCQEMSFEYVSTAISSAPSYDSGMRKGWRGPSAWASDGRVCNPCSLFDAVCAKAPRFRGFQQQDSHELLRYLLEGLNLEERGVAMTLPSGDYKRVLSTSLSKVLGQNGQIADSESAKEDQEHGKANKPSQMVPTFVERVFGGQLSSTVHCRECGHVSVVCETMLDLSLQIPTRQNSRKRQVSEEQGTLNLLGGRSQESLEKDSKHVESAEMLERQQTFVASTLETVVSKERLLESSVSAQADRLDPSLTKGAESPQIGTFNAFPSHNPDFHNSSGAFAEGSLQNIPYYCADNLEKTLSANVKVLKPGKIFKADSDLSAHEQSLNLNGSKVDTCLRMDSAFTNCVSSGWLQSFQGERSTTHSGEWLQGTDVLASSKDKSSVSGMLRLECDRVGEVSSNSEDSSALFEYTATECDFYKLSCKESKDLSNSQSETRGYQISRSQGSESAEMVSAKTQEVKAFKCDLKADRAIEKKISMDSSGEANGEASDKTKVDIGSEQFTSSEDTALPLSLEACLADFIKSELLCGENAWECEKCSKLADVTSHSESLNNKPKHGESDVSSEVIKILGHDFGESRDGKSALGVVEALSRASSMNFEPDSPVFVIGNQEQTQSVCVNVTTLPTFGLENNQKSMTEMPVETCKGAGKLDIEGVNDYTHTGDSRSLLSDKSVISHPLLDKHEHPEGNGAGHTYSKILPNLRMEKMSFFSNLFFRPDNHKVKIDQKQKLVKREAMKKYLICKVPLVLTLQLKRFAQDVRGRLNKLSGHVAFPEYLNIQPFLDPRCHDYDHCRYRLVGIVEHRGTMRGGHYVAYVRGPSEDVGDAWYHISDSVVSQSCLQDVLGREAYLLFYERHSMNKEG